MAGIYFHIPFCHRACSYCDFHFSTSLKAKHDVISAMKTELINRLPELSNNVKTIYFGGGTPSILNPEEIRTFIELIKERKKIEIDAEITLECNPEDLNESNLNKWYLAGINRLSIGVQSFNPVALKILNRAHSKSQAITGIDLAQKTGFNNISIDLIFSIPGLQANDLKSDLKQLLDLNPEHISCYQLTIEPRTALAHQIKNNKFIELDDESSRQQFLLIHDVFTNQGYKHYEISNYAKPGFESKHNTAYWTRDQYLGIGPSAHSFINGNRRWNVSNNAAYIKNINDPSLYVEEILNDKDLFNEMIMTGLRTDKGINLSALKRISPNLNMEVLKLKTDRWKTEGLAKINNDKLVLTPDGWLISDGLAVELFQV